MATATGAATTTVPGHKTAATLIQHVANYVQVDSADAEVRNVVLSTLNSGVGLINSRNWHCLHATTDLTNTASDDDLGLPTNFKAPIGVWTVNSSDERIYRMPYKPLKSLLLERENNDNTGEPMAYGINYVSRELILEVQPSSAWVSQYPELRMFYHKRLPEFTDSSDVILGQPEWEWFLVWHGRRELAAIRDEGKFGLADRMAEQYWRQMIRADTDQMTDWAE